ncbi:MAG TPA: type 1 glutamine amidotransferase domain-containing protein [Balneolaceae bacterium]|nr:type 1 glutamine amidotransferase domain-containing protein [Balneolaceae bacterium]
MNNQLGKKNIAILATNGFEEVELAQPRKALEDAGATTYIVSPESESITAWDHDHWSDEYDVDVPLDKTNAEEFDALLLPGGVLNPDQLRLNEKAIQFVTQFLHDRKPVAAICHGAQTLIETGELKGKKMTSYPSIKTDLINAGANWVDEEVVVDRGLVTSRKPADIPAFNDKMIEEFSKGIYSEISPN